MKIANLSDVKDQLSRYVEMVRRGDRVRILVHGVPAADLVPVADPRADKSFGEQELAELERNGIVRRGRGAWTKELDRPGPRVRNNAGVDALLDERRAGR